MGEHKQRMVEIAKSKTKTYWISEAGVVTSVDRRGNSRVIKTRYLVSNDRPYEMCTYSDATGKIKCIFIHRTLAEVFLDKPISDERLVVDHINNDPTDNRLENLQWITHSENIKKNAARGESHSSCKISDTDVIEVRRLLDLDWHPLRIAKKFNVSKQLIRNIKDGKTR